jgi:hypothetical protein
MSLRFIGVIALVALVIGTVIAVDALTVSDEELLEKFIDDVTGTVDRDYVYRALGYVDLGPVPLDVEVLLPVESHTGVYDASRAAELESMFRRRIRPYYGEYLRAFQKKIVIDDDRADVGFTVLSRRLRARAELKMRKVGERWLVASVRISR